MARTKKKASRKGKRNPQWTGAAGTEASWFGRALGHEKWPDSDYPYDVPGQVTGKYRGYLFRVYQRPRGVGFVKESWDWKDRHHLMLPYAPTKAQAVHEVKQRIDEYIREGSGVRNPKMKNPTRWGRSVAKKGDWEVRMGPSLDPQFPVRAVLLYRGEVHSAADGQGQWVKKLVMGDFRDLSKTSPQRASNPRKIKRGRKPKKVSLRSVMAKASK